jgi:molybdopterin/thiamine biosynthesis adenylyltransferase
MKNRRPDTRRSQPGKHAVVIGLGNIGSPLVELLARTEAVTRLTLVDRDTYEAANLSGQAIRPEDVGRPKALVQAERARRIRPGLSVEAIHAPVEDVPLGRLRGDVVLTGLDSKLSRQQVNQRVWRLGVPWVDAGVLAAGRLVRVNVYVPGGNQPCLECAWDERDYQTLEVPWPCQAGSGNVRTDAPAFLGSLAAAFQLAECEKILAGNRQSVAAGKQVTLAAAAHKLYETTFRRNPRCRFDHALCRTHPLRCDPAALQLDGLMRRLRRKLGGRHPLRFHVEGRSFVLKLRCACGHEKLVFWLEGRMTARRRGCPRCGETMGAVGFSMLPFVSEATLLPAERKQTLAAMGLRIGDMLMTKSGGKLNAFELIAR